MKINLRSTVCGIYFGFSAFLIATPPAQAVTIVDYNFFLEDLTSSAVYTGTLSIKDTALGGAGVFTSFTSGDITALSVTVGGITFGLADVFPSIASVSGVITDSAGALLSFDRSDSPIASIVFITSDFDVLVISRLLTRIIHASP